MYNIPPRSLPFRLKIIQNYRIKGLFHDELECWVIRKIPDYVTNGLAYHYKLQNI
jgi:hypothetical protein